MFCSTLAILYFSLLTRYSPLIQARRQAEEAKKQNEGQSTARTEGTEEPQKARTGSKPAVPKLRQDPFKLTRSLLDQQFNMIVNGYMVASGVHTAARISSAPDRFASSSTSSTSSKKPRLVNGMVPIVAMIPGVFFDYPWFTSTTSVWNVSGVSCRSMHDAVAIGSAGGTDSSVVSNGGKVICWVHEAFLHDVTHSGSIDGSATDEFSVSHLYAQNCRGCERVSTQQEKSRNQRLRREKRKQGKIQHQVRQTDSSVASSSCDGDCTMELEQKQLIYEGLVKESTHAVPRYQDLWEEAGRVAFERHGTKRRRTAIDE